jgi:PAS domain S-box-containing protein
VVDPRGVVVALSKGACRLLGYEPADVVGRVATGLLTDPLPVALRHGCAQRQGWSGRVTVRHRDGDRLALAVQAHPLVDSAGEAYWFLTVARLRPYAPGDGDAPNTVLLKPRALDQLPLPMALYDRAGVRIEINAAMTRATGKPDHDLLGWPVGHSASGRTFADSRGVAEALRQVVATGEPVTTELHGMGPGDAARRVWSPTPSATAPHRSTCGSSVTRR